MLKLSQIKDGVLPHPPAGNVGSLCLMRQITPNTEGLLGFSTQPSHPLSLPLGILGWWLKTPELLFPAIGLSLPWEDEEQVTF